MATVEVKIIGNIRGRVSVRLGLGNKSHVSE